MSNNLEYIIFGIRRIYNEILKPNGKLNTIKGKIQKRFRKVNEKPNLT